MTVARSTGPWQTGASPCDRRDASDEYSSGTGDRLRTTMARSIELWQAEASPCGWRFPDAEADPAFGHPDAPRIVTALDTSMLSSRKIVTALDTSMLSLNCLLHVIGGRQPTLLLAQAPGATKHRLTAVSTAGVGSRQTEASPRMPALRHPRYTGTSAIEGEKQMPSLTRAPTEASSSAFDPPSAGEVRPKETPSTLRYPRYVKLSATEGESMPFLVQAVQRPGASVLHAAGPQLVTRSKADVEPWRVEAS
jgi:hypothetical protein